VENRTVWERRKVLWKAKNEWYLMKGRGEVFKGGVLSSSVVCGGRVARAMVIKWT
jgi:hypothetical protein